MSHDHSNAHRRTLMMHLVAAVVVLIKGLTKVMDASYLKGGLILGLGVLMLGMALNHHWLEERFPKAVPFFFLFEAIVVGIVAWSSWGKTYAFLYVIAAVGYLIAFGIHLNKLRQAG